MGKRRKQGEKSDNNVTKNQILLILCEHPEGVEEPELRDTIKDKCGISDPKGIKIHLKDLEKDNYLLKKEQSGKANIWILKPDSFLEIAKKFFDTPGFHSSAYCQRMITPALLREIEKLWIIKAPYKPEKELETLHKDHLERLKKRAEAGVEGITKEEWPDILKANEVQFYTEPFYFTEEDVLKILRLSPTSLKKALEGTDIKEKRNIIFEAKNCGYNQNPSETLRRTYFQQMLLASLILDSTTDNYLGYMFDPELSIKIHPLHKGAPDNNKFFHKKAGLSTLHPVKYIGGEFLNSYSMV